MKEPRKMKIAANHQGVRTRAKLHQQTVSNRSDRLFRSSSTLALIRVTPFPLSLPMGERKGRTNPAKPERLLPCGVKSFSLRLQWNKGKGEGIVAVVHKTSRFQGLGQVALESRHDSNSSLPNFRLVARSISSARIPARQKQNKLRPSRRSRSGRGTSVD